MINTLVEKIKKLNAPIVVGLDPKLQFVPEFIQKKAFEEYGVAYENIWKDYLAEEYELVKNRKIGNKGNYVYFIIDTYAQDIIDLIK